MKTVMYGFARDSVSKVMKVESKYVLYGRDASIWSIKYAAKKLLEERPLEEIYVVDARLGLKEDYLEAVRRNDNAAWVEFHDMIVRDGIRIDI